MWLGSSGSFERSRSTLYPAIVEPTPEDPHPHLRQCSYAELYELVAGLVSALLQYGIKPGDRVASYSSNCIVSN